ncbi:MAG: hypothetical protein ACLFPQ_03010 [Candidatus Woesearchaeota archaeon]
MIGECICTRCGFKMKAPAGDCSLVKCPRCGSSMKNSSGMKIHKID